MKINSYEKFLIIMKKYHSYKLLTIKFICTITELKTYCTKIAIVLLAKEHVIVDLILKSHRQSMSSINTKYHKVIKLYMFLFVIIDVILTSELAHL